MQWIFFLAAITYYLYRAYQQEKEKNVNKPLTPVNKPPRQGSEKSADTKIDKPKSLQEIWKQLQEAARQQVENPETIIEKPKKPAKKQDAVNFENTPLKTPAKMDEIPAEEGGTSLGKFPKTSTETTSQTTVKEKYLMVNGKKMLPKDMVIASIIFERRF